MIPVASLAGIHVFFPDPWPKKRHHKRRLLKPGFVHELARRLAPGGYLHVATDWEDYAHEDATSTSRRRRVTCPRPPPTSRRPARRSSSPG
ncbi:tRNA (guanine(46)-N(7))-methyltransferase TrmB [Methanothrix soehngenii]|uniref:tRNA (guanine(46)-N(7))-methyltransferase TrmB n=1 Tax=Methanothrix soehngenii TaxID=2223 RepID=UPI003AB9723E